MSCTGHCFDIGNTTKKALLRFEEKGELYAGSEEDPATNGSIMRLVPINLFFHGDLEKCLFYAGESSRITHAPIQCIDACRSLAFLIEKALLSKSKEEILDYKNGELNLCPEIEAVMLGSYKEKSREEISAIGLAVTCLEAALWSFYHSSSFNEGVFLAVNLGEDSDTTGAVFGQLAGAFYGVEAIRQDFLDDLHDKKLLEKTALELFTFNQNPFFKLGENLTVDLIVYNPHDEVLVIRRKNDSEACPGMLAFPGGFIDDGESPKQAAIRELLEETNLKLNADTDLQFVGCYVGNKRDPRDNQFSWAKTFAFTYTIDLETFEREKNSIRGLDDAEEAKWIKFSELQLIKLAFDHNQLLQDSVNVRLGKTNPSF